MGSKRFPLADRRALYEETFDNGPGGWFAWKPGHALPPEIRDGIFFTRSPWWVDPNHAPPGAGYLHLLAFIHTRGGSVPEDSSPNRFVEGGYSRNFTNAQVTIRVRGDVDLRGAEMVLLVQADIPGTRANYVLTGQPFRVTPEWTEQTVKLTPDPTQWVCMGTHRDLTHYYGCGDITDVLRDVNVDIIFVLFPLQIVPVGRVDDIHNWRTHRDYEVDYHYLPEGEIQIDTVWIEYPNEQP